MGEVYRAHDTTLDRDVAIKVLPEAFASDPERLARFEREAKVLARGRAVRDADWTAGVRGDGYLRNAGVRVEDRPGPDQSP